MNFYVSYTIIFFQKWLLFIWKYIDQSRKLQVIYSQSAYEVCCYKHISNYLKILSLIIIKINQMEFNY